MANAPLVCNANEVNNDITRVMLWATPRSTSTAFLKCMTYVPDTLAFCEPYWQCHRYSKDAVNRQTIYEFKRKYQGAGFKDNDDHLRGIEGGYLATEKGYTWVKEQLEATPPGKKMIFCKDLIGWPAHGHYERLPSGFQHTFLIRNPYLTFHSWKKCINTGVADDMNLHLTDLPGFYMPEGMFFKEQYHLYKYAKETLGQNPPIVDADELLANPAGVMKAYFKAIGVLYSDDYLHWKPGNECIERLWVVAKEHIYGQRRWHGVTFESTGFGSPKKCPDPADLPEDVVYYADLCMKYYEEMYANTLKPL
ncbi:uncharacterized protein [Amphiura filiformis]|uniref:uncharacterized protein n=1 Tax=Amphiura filiformis TaxID=82378 RepID=UPI003B21A832